MKRAGIMSVIFVCVSVIFVCVLIGSYFKFYQIDTVSVPVRKEIERAIQVENLENKFCYMRRMFLGGAGAGGIGAPQVICNSAKQFVEMVPEKETIYTAFEFPVQRGGEGGLKRTTINKVYWAFIENRAGLIVYEDEYFYHKNWDRYWVEDYDSETVHFRYDNELKLIVYLVTIGLAGLLVVLIFIL